MIKLKCFIIVVKDLCSKDEEIRKRKFRELVSSKLERNILNRESNILNRESNILNRESNTFKSEK